MLAPCLSMKHLVRQPRSQGNRQLIHLGNAVMNALLQDRQGVATGTYAFRNETEVLMIMSTWNSRQHPSLHFLDEQARHE